ncbi:MAG: hypothetical protein ACO27C_02060 [Candidatus Limnocylindrus sp.]|jgi:hypothetical protein
MKTHVAGLLAVALLVAACSGTDKDGVPIADPVGGFGENVGAVSCDAGGHDAAYHIHSQLTIKLPDGTTAEVPPNIGINQNCMYWLHTHEPDGQLHVEAPDETLATLADFLEIWRRSTNPTIPNAVNAGLAEIRVMGELVESAASVELKEGLGIEITVISFPE